MTNTRAIENLEFVFLGTGTSGGIPVIACDCEACTSSDPKDTRLRQGAALRWIDPQGNPRTVLIDATPDLRQQALQLGLQRCDAILFTHHHVDHVFGLDEVRRFNIAMRAPIDIYAEPATLAHLHRIYRHVFDRASNENDSFVATLNEHEIEPGDTIELFGLRFTPFRLLHGRLPILGYRIEAAHPRMARPDVLPLAYCTDTSQIPDESREHLQELSTLVLDALRPKPHPTHLHLDAAIAEAQRIAADRTYFVHIAHEILHERVNADLPDRIRLAYDGLTLGALDPAHDNHIQNAAATPDDRFDEG